MYLREGGHDARIAAGCQNVYITRRLRTAANTPDDGERDVRAFGAEILQKRLGRFGRLRQKMAAGMLPALGAGPQNLLLLFSAEALQSPDPTICAGRLEFINGTDTELAVEQCHRPGSHALKVHELQDRRRKLVEQLTMKASLACLGDFTDLGREVLADPRNRA